MDIASRLATTVGLATLLSACGGSPPALPPAPVAGSGATLPPAPGGATLPPAPVAGSGVSLPPAPVVGSDAALPAASPSASVETVKLEFPAPSDVKWEARGRRDPFEPLVAREGAAGTTVSSAKLTGIVRRGGTALALVETPDGLGYILKAGDTLGDGRVLEIGQNTVVFSIVPRPGITDNRVVLRLAGE
ncbi:MAG TPA: hypothetical protein VLF19_01530 [Methylomirabilota bacterium]|nr:hypothetical protein [Methylomirabilota bacterium]